MYICVHISSTGDGLELRIGLRAAGSGIGGLSLLEIGSLPRRDRSSSGTRSVRFRVEIGPAPARDRRSAPEHALGACPGGLGRPGPRAAGVEVCARRALWDWWHSPPVGCSTSMRSARAPGLDRTPGSRLADRGTRRSGRAITGTGAGTIAREAGGLAVAGPGRSEPLSLIGAPPGLSWSGAVGASGTSKASLGNVNVLVQRERTFLPSF